MFIKDIYNFRGYSKEYEIGIEIEMEGESLPGYIENYWKVDRDGSLRGEAFEYVLRQPIEREKVQKALNILGLEFKANRSILAPSHRCGVHIHINCQYMTIEQLFNFIILYLMLEEIMMRWCGTEREGNIFCLRAKDAEYLIDSLIKAKEKYDLNDIMNDKYRYSSLNISSIAKYGSLEFRGLNTPKDFNKIQDWIRFLLLIKDYSLKIDDAREIMQNVSFGMNVFLKEVFLDDCGQIMCDGWDEILRRGIWLVQDIAYISKPIWYKQFLAEEKELDRIRPKEKLVQMQAPAPRHVLIQHIRLEPDRINQLLNRAN